MMPRYDYWTHGSSVAVQRPDRLRDQLRWGYGSQFEQDADSENWFHFAIPTPTVAEDDERVDLRYLRFRAHTNENARVVEITAHQDNSKRIHDERPPDFLSGDIDYRVGSLRGTIKREIGGSIVLCVRVEFLTGRPRGQVSFFGAGGRFDT